MSSLIRDHATNRPATVEDLDSLEILAGLDPEVLEWIAAHASVIELRTDEVFMEFGQPAEEMVIILSGAMEFEFRLPGQEPAYGEYEAGDVTGTLPYSRMKTYPGTATATEPTRVLWLGREHLTDLVRTSVELGQRLVAIMADRVRDATRYGEQRERMAALGKLAAGLAHELNNPASAVSRSSAVLRERLSALPTLVAHLSDAGLTYEQVCLADRLRTAAAANAAARFDTMERSAREDAMADWLERHDVPEAAMRAETLVDSGLTPEDLTAATEDLPAPAIPAAVAWVEGGLAAQRLVDEIETAASRVSELVTAVKSYSYMDRAHDRQPTDIREGLEITLTILNHKLRRKDITVERSWPDDLPAVAGHPGELNQVWTNLIDNAADAMDAGGTLRIEAERVGQHVQVRIIDDGAGIPADLQTRIFEPFFTTKDVGQGTGLGLDIVHRIITGKHGGAIDVESAPGRTVFTVRLPLSDSA